VSRWEAGTEQPDYKSLRALTGAYHCKASDLMPRNQYPSAPLDPEERQEWVWQRNARIQGVADVDATVKAWREKRDKARERPSALPKEKP
jgi:transcriptional regulator with XRE-family HTH domain